MVKIATVTHVICKESPCLCLCLCSLYLNPVTDVGKQSLYAPVVPMNHDDDRKHVEVLVSVTEGSEVSKNWHPILSVIQENALSWDKECVKQQLKVHTHNGNIKT